MGGLPEEGDRKKAEGPELALCVRKKSPPASS